MTYWRKLLVFMGYLGRINWKGGSWNTLAREEGYVQELTEKQSWKLFDRPVHYYPGVSGEEFVARWESGSYKGPDAEPGRMSVVMLLPFARSR